MNRIDLFVAPEDYPQLRTLGARWDQRSKCWYIDAAMRDERFAAWMPAVAADNGSEQDFPIESSDAFVARASSICQNCSRSIEVVCLYCRRGTVSGEPQEAFRVESVWAVDEELRRQLQRCPGYRMNASAGIYLNHCPQCGRAQDELALHEEPGQPFHDLGREVPHDVQLEALDGWVRLSGDYCIEV